MQTEKSREDDLTPGQYEEAYIAAASFRKNFPREVEGELRRLNVLSRNGELTQRERAYYEALQRI